MCCSSKRSRCANMRHSAYACHGGCTPYSAARNDPSMRSCSGCGRGCSHSNCSTVAHCVELGPPSRELNDIIRQISRINDPAGPPTYSPSNTKDVTTTVVDEKQAEIDPPEYEQVDGAMPRSTSLNHNNGNHPNQLLSPIVAKYAQNATIVADLKNLDEALKMYGARECGGWGMVRRAKKQLRKDLQSLEERHATEMGAKWRCKERKVVKREVNEVVSRLMDEARE